MADTPANIYPIFDQLMPRASKESMLGQHAKVIWMTGLSGSGKSTIAKGLEKALQEQGILTMVLDGDNVRTGINNNLGFSDADRTENIRRIAEVARLFLQCGVVTICCFVSPTHAIRNLARQIIGSQDFVEVFVNTPIEECERRDVKGLYAKARAGEIKDFTGINAPFEAPENPEINLLTGGKSPEQSTADLLDRLLPQIKIK